MSSQAPKMGLVRAAVAAVLVLAMAGSAAAGVIDHGVYKVERAVLPYWQVGSVDKALSRACSMGQFNQRVPYRFAGHFYGPYGTAMLGAAKGSGLNLFDPFKRADKQRDYWFYRDRTSACIVMWAPVKDTGAPPVAPQPAAATAPTR